MTDLLLSDMIWHSRGNQMDFSLNFIPLEVMQSLSGFFAEAVNALCNACESHIGGSNPPWTVGRGDDGSFGSENLLFFSSVCSAQPKRSRCNEEDHPWRWPYLCKLHYYLLFEYYLTFSGAAIIAMEGKGIACARKGQLWKNAELLRFFCLVLPSLRRFHCIMSMGKRTPMFLASCEIW